MKVLVVNNMAPFIRGGAEELADHLVRNLRTAGHQAELQRIPFNWDPAERLLDEVLLNRGLRVQNVDRIIALKFPAYLLPFENKVLWLLHQYRQAYDLWDAGQSNIPDNARGNQIRDAIRTADDACFASTQKIFVNSRVTRDRLAHYNGFPSQILMPPLNDPEMFVDGGLGDYVFAGGRINASKRQHLLVEAMRYVRSGVKLVVGGPVDSTADELQLRQLVTDHNLADSVTLDIGYLPRQRYADYMNNALACAYLPFDEDSVGYVTMEACHAGKAVITVDDSGGLLDLVEDGLTGRVCPPDARALAEAMDGLHRDRDMARRMGSAGKFRWSDKGINWPKTIERLVA